MHLADLLLLLSLPIPPLLPAHGVLQRVSASSALPLVPAPVVAVSPRQSHLL